MLIQSWCYNWCGRSRRSFYVGSGLKKCFRRIRIQTLHIENTVVFFWLKWKSLLCPEILQCPIVQRFCNAPRSLWEMPDSNPEPLSRKSGALPMSHHISKSLHMLNIPAPTVHNFFNTVEIVSRCLLFWMLNVEC